MKIGIFGASGSVGGQVLDVIAQNRDKFEAAFLSAHSDADGLIKKAAEFRPSHIALTDDAYLKSAEKRAEFEKKVLEIGGGGYNPVVLYGSGYFREIFKDGKNPLSLDLAVVAVTGSHGLLPSYFAVESGVPLAVANKETLVSGGEIIMRGAALRGVSVIPVDSEHSAISECLAGNDRGEVRRLILTASGGAFRDYSLERLKTASAADALKHPTWRMGKKVTVDSATMMNKGLEIIEAMRLFGLPESKIDVAVHPESVVHSLVEFFDNTVMAMMSVPDMRIPISRALGVAYAENMRKNRRAELQRNGEKTVENCGSEFQKSGEKTIGNGGIDPRKTCGAGLENGEAECRKSAEKAAGNGGIEPREIDGVNRPENRAFGMRIKNSASALDLIKMSSLTFLPPDLTRFPCLKIARDAAAADGIMPAVLNAANECAAEDFLNGRIRFTDIAPRISAVLERTENLSPGSIEDVLEAEKEAKRRYFERLV
ncbi:MAG: 1-deoxy-D-xylulose-5-phosphate reductoisomerase [Clostridiales bacterium]|jgi:1-deoxy-D-xylulose-5-phosphate reductoisomerase|nr:1-deoxy-D-xylulose-5-phosphate reductoisomerase [Clostridiales bacterium]